MNHDVHGTALEFEMVDAVSILLLSSSSPPHSVHDHHQHHHHHHDYQSLDVLDDTVKRMSSLHIAAGKGNLDIVKLLIEHGHDVNRADAAGNTPLYDTNSSEH
jgi:ankyrin repeat protein